MNYENTIGYANMESIATLVGFYIMNIIDMVALVL